MKKKMKGGSCLFGSCSRKKQVVNNSKGKERRRRSESPPPFRAPPVITPSPPVYPGLKEASDEFNRQIKKSYLTSPPTSRLPAIALSSRLPSSEYPAPFSLSSPLPSFTPRNSTLNQERRKTASTWVDNAHAAAIDGASNEEILRIARTGVKAATGNPNSNIPALLRRGGATRKRKSKHAQ